MARPVGSGPDVPSGKREWWPIIAAGIALLVVFLLPSLAFLVFGYAEDETATGEVKLSSVLTLIGIEAVVGAVAAGIAWAVARSAIPGRTVWTAIILVGAAGWGFLSGFLGGVALAYERHPTWDDA